MYFRCLDSILHAEHKNILEEMRISYSLTHSAKDKGMINEDATSLERKFVTKVEEPDMTGDSTTGVGSMERCREENIEPENSIFSSYGLDLRYLFSSSTNNMKKNSGAESRLVTDCLDSLIFSVPRLNKFFLSYSLIISDERTTNDNKTGQTRHLSE